MMPRTTIQTPRGALAEVFRFRGEALADPEVLWCLCDPAAIAAFNDSVNHFVAGNPLPRP
jgi:hypothetical protein